MLVESDGLGLYMLSSDFKAVVQYHQTNMKGFKFKNGEFRSKQFIEICRSLSDAFHCPVYSRQDHTIVFPDNKTIALCPGLPPPSEKEDLLTFYKSKPDDVLCYDEVMTKL